MAVTDVIADMLTRIRNAIVSRHDTVVIPTSNLKVSLARVLKEEGFIRDFEMVRGVGVQGNVRIFLHYRGKDEPAISGLRRVSKPGLRVFVKKNEIPRYYGGAGAVVLSTSQGVMTGRKAWQKGLGGELLCYVW